MAKRQAKQTNNIKKLLDDQTKVILSAVDAKLVSNKTDILSAVDKRLRVTEIKLISVMDEKIRKSEERINKKIDKLITTVDKFLTRLIRIEDEFEAMKLDINRLKTVIREKLGVEL